MKNLLKLAGALALALVMPCPAIAQSTIPGKPISAPAGYLPGMAIYCDDGTGLARLCNFASSGGGGSAGDPSSTGTPGAAAPATVSVIGVYDGSAVRRMLADSAGRAVVNVNALPALPAGSNTIGTVNLGTLNGAATVARQDAMITALGSPFQAGASIGNTAFGAKLQDGNGTAIGTAANPVVVDTLYRGASIDRGGIFGTTAAQLVAANAARRGLSIQVQGSTGSCYINGSATATADYHSLQIPAGNYWESPDGYSGTGAVSIVCTAANTSVYARER